MYVAAATKNPTRNLFDGFVGGKRVDEFRHGALAIVQTDAIDRRVEKGLGVSGGGVPAHDEKRLGPRVSDARDDIPHVIDFERMHAGDTDQIRPHRLQNRFYRR